MITILLAEDHTVVRQGVRSLLEAERDMSVVGETGDGLEAVKLAEKLNPKVMIVDLMMPGLGGLEVVRHLGKSAPDIRIVVLSMHADEGYVIEALRQGATGYVLKDADSSELVQAVRRVADGRRYLSPPLSERAIEAYMGRDDEGPFDVYNTLTAREREVLHLAAHGHTNAQIADKLSISPRTVEVHRANMMHKLDLASQTDLIRYALTKGILPMET